MTKKEIIIQWLKDNGVFEQFCNNSPNKEFALDRFLILSVFAWQDTPEGPDFWSKIDDEYCDWYENVFDNHDYVNFKEINK